MGLKHLLVYRLPRKLIALLPTQLRAKVKRRVLSWLDYSDPLDALPISLPEPTTPPVVDAPISIESAEVSSLLERLAFPTYQLTQPRLVDSAAQPATLLPDVIFENRNGTVLVSMCTMNFLHFARTMIASLREHHSAEEVAIYLLLIDWDGQEPVDLPDVQVFSGKGMGIDRFDYMALKFNAMELCCACKPHFLHYVMANTRYRKILFIDTDIYIFAPLTELLTSLDEASLVITPHTFAPPPPRDGSHVRPRLKEIMYAGSYNSGIIGMTVVPQNVEFVRKWAEILAMPTSFLDDHDLENVEQEQQLYNWLVSLSDDVKVLKNRAYNVAYWNLHDRSLRYTGWDDADGPLGWQVDGAPLVAFHFSGFSLHNPQRLSRHDFRYDLYFLPSVTQLVEFYVNQLLKNGGLEAQDRPYLFNHFPSGLPILPEIRIIFKKHEAFLWTELNPWTQAGEHYYAQRLFLPVAQTASLLPVMLYYLYQRRVDLQAAFPTAHLDPQPMIDWYALSGLTEDPTFYQYYNLRRPVVPCLTGLVTLQTILQKHPEAFAGLKHPMSADRSTLINRLRENGHVNDALQIQSTSFEHFAVSPIYLLWKFVQHQPQFGAEFHNLLFDDAPAFSEWLQTNAAHYAFPPELPEIFLRKAQGHSLARIFSFLNESWELMSQWPLALVGQNKEACIVALLGQVQYDRQFDLDDIVMYAWVMETQPWAGLPLTFELLVNACRKPSPLLPEGQDALLGPLLSQHGFREALVAYRNAHKLDELRIRGYENRVPMMNSWPSLDPAQGSNRGVNLFGYFKSPIGLGSLSHGLALALGSIDVTVQKSVLNLASMEKDLHPADFIRTYNHSLDTNLFVSYPHLPYRLLTTYPDHVVKDRKNIVYLAWEQRDGYPTWDQDYAGFDQIWALSEFAAGSFRRYMKRDDVFAVPGVVDFDSFPATASKNEVGLDPERFIFLYVFDAHSSIERKNPEAAILAFAQAFSPSEKVQLLLKVTNAHRLDCRPRLQRLTRLAVSTGMDIRFVLENMPRKRVLQTISAVDCYVSLHRAEGFGYTCAEAMAYGRPVIATNYSGTTEFMDDQSAFLVDYRECEVAEADGPFQRGSIWAEPSVEHAAAQMRRVFLNRQLAQKIGETGSIKVRELLSAQRIGQIAAAALKGKLRNGTGA